MFSLAGSTPASRCRSAWPGRQLWRDEIEQPGEVSPALRDILWLPARACVVVIHLERADGAHGCERRRQGWKHGPERNKDRKLHPDLVSWEERTEGAREKDRVMIRDFPAFLAKARFQVEEGRR